MNTTQTAADEVELFTLDQECVLVSADGEVRALRARLNDLRRSADAVADREDMNGDDDEALLVARNVADSLEIAVNALDRASEGIRDASVTIG